MNYIIRLNFYSKITNLKLGERFLNFCNNTLSNKRPKILFYVYNF